MGRRKAKGDPVHGWLVLDKPYGLTSTSAVGKVRHLMNAQKAGHAGTLDPLATGLLPIALGEATKTVPYLIDADKVYRFTVRFGEARDTDDREGEVTETSSVRPETQDIEAMLADMTGALEQVPPRYSAIKIDGERAYDLARAGEAVELKSRTVDIYESRLVARPDADHAEIEIACSKGTYVRAYARDLARRLGTCGHVSGLRRTAHGPFSEAQAISLDKLIDFSHSAPPDALRAHLLPIETALDDIPALALSGTEAARLRQGQSVLVRGRDAPVFEGAVLAMHKGDPVALTEYCRGALKPVRVFNLTLS